MQTITIRHTYALDLPDYGERMDIERLIDVVKRSGSHFFDADTMRWFKSRVDYVTYAGPDGWYFVTSEKHVCHLSTHTINEPRMYTVRRLSVAPSGNDLRLYELFGFQQFPTLQRARTAARKASEHGIGICPDCSLRLQYDGKPCDECAQRRVRLSQTAAS